MNQNPTTIARTGQGRYQWEATGWFGATIGGSSWLAVSAIDLAGRQQYLGCGIAAAAWLAVSAYAAWLWARRGLIDPFRAIARILVLFSVLTPIVWFACWDAPTPDAEGAFDWQRVLCSVVACATAPGVFLCLYLRERQHLRGDRMGGGQSNVGV